MATRPMTRSGAPSLTSPPPGPLPLSSWTCVRFRQVRRDDCDVVGGFLGCPFPSFAGGPSGGSLSVFPVEGVFGDGGAQEREWVVSAGRPPSAVPAACVGGDVVADQGEHGGEGDGGEAGPGGGGGCRRKGRDHVVHEEQRPGFLPGEGGRPAAQHAAGTADGSLQVKKSGLHLPSRRVEGRDLPCREGVRVQ